MGKWRYAGIPHIDEMRTVFQGVTAKSHHVWTPGEPRVPFVRRISHGTLMEDDVEILGDSEEDGYQPVYDLE